MSTVLGRPLPWVKLAFIRSRPAVQAPALQRAAQTRREKNLRHQGAKLKAKSEDHKLQPQPSAATKGHNQAPHPNVTTQLQTQICNLS